MDVLTAHQRQVADRVLAEEGTRRRHLVVSLSGSHAYGFPSPDSDLDLKAVHIEPTVGLLGLAPPALHASRFEVVDGVEVDYSSNEVQPVLAALLGGNGNYFERFLGAIALVVSPELDELRPIWACPDSVDTQFMLPALLSASLPRFHSDCGSYS